MQINEELNKKKIFSTEIKSKQGIEILNEVKYINIYDSKHKKIQEEIKDKIIDKYLKIIISQQKEIDQLKKQLNDSIQSSIAILKNSLNNRNINTGNINNNINNILLSQQSQKQKLKNEILNINNINNKSKKNNIMVHILNRNQHKNLSYSTISSDNIKLKKNNTQINGLTVEYKKNSKEKNNLSLSNSRIQLNKYEIISPKRIKIEKIKKRKTNSKNKKERESTHTTINNIDINELNTYYLKEYNKKDNQKIEEIKTKLQNNNLPPPQLPKNEPISQKNKNNNNIYKAYSQNKFKKVINQNVVNKSNKYSYGKNNLKKIFNSPKSIRTQFNINDKNKIFNEYYIKKNKMSKNNYEENKVFLDNNYLYPNPAYNTKNIIHKNININNNNNKIYINTDSNYLQNIKGINKHFKTQTNFYQHKIITRGDNQLSLNYKDIMLTTPNDNHFDNQ